METPLFSPRGKEVIIGPDRPMVLIGERINPFGKGPLKAAMLSGDMGPIRSEALDQLEAGADVLLISVGAFGLDETILLPQVVETVKKTVDVPICLESRNPEALEKALSLGCGRPIISSINGESDLAARILPLVKKYDTALVILASDASGVPHNAAQRLEILTGLLEKAQSAGIGPQDLLADGLAESTAVNDRAGLTTLETMKAVRDKLGLNQTLGASNVSFGLPNRITINAVFLSMAVQSGLTSAIVNVKPIKPYMMAADLLLGRDKRARRYTAYFRKTKNVPSP
jgi:5-methyltetrahydrofolate--homocysteine methyltransferase